MGKSGLLAAAAGVWRAQLIDLSGNNRLLYFKETKASFTLDGADPKVVAKLLKGEEVSLKKLFSDSEKASKATASAGLLFKKQKESLEEFSIPIAYLAIGFVGWVVEDKANSSNVRRTNAPVLMAPVQLEKMGNSSEDFKLTILEEPQFNSVLAHSLRTSGVKVDEDELPIEIIEDGEVDTLLGKIKEQATILKDVETASTIVLGPFSYQKQAMVNDLENLDSLAKSDLISALANDQSAIGRVRTQIGEIGASDPDYAPVESEYLVLDADSSQSFVVNAAIAGRNLVVEGPPGTGKSQTIANVIACLVADNKTVLFVAQKRAAVEAVLSRLEAVELNPILLDAFLAGAGRRFISAELAKSFDNQRTVVDGDVKKLQRTLERSRDVLVKHKDALHVERFGWGPTIHELRVLSLEEGAHLNCDFRIDCNPLTNWEESDFDGALEAFQELSVIGALSAKWNEGLFWDFKSGRWDASASELVEAATVIKSKLDELCTWISANPGALDSSNVLTALDYPELFAVLKAQRDLLSINSGIEHWDIDAINLRRVYDAVSGSEVFENGERVGILSRYGLKRQANKVLKGFELEAQAELIRLLMTSRSSSFVEPSGLSVTEIEKLLELEDLQDDIDWLAESTVGLDLKITSEELSLCVSSLISDPDLRKLSRACSAFETIRDLELVSLFDYIVESQGQAEEERSDVYALAKHIIVSSLLEAAELHSPDVSGFSGKELQTITEEFRNSDINKLSANAVRIRRLAAERLAEVRNSHGEQERLIVKELTKKSKFKSINSLFREAPEVLLAAKPVWPMSPLQV